ncbi:MAG: DUF4031 domain-containing protein [Acidimicrobiia bacterium]|jgi:hypothetical protein|nr:DUF4031 domain-containing protein [Acidimicrobiia bacterium]
MAVYVDPALWAWRGRQWCHLLADDEVELHAFAQRLGLERRRFQHRDDAPWRDHYDLPDHVRAEAVTLGAVEITVHDAGRLVRSRRPRPEPVSPPPVRRPGRPARA